MEITLHLELRKTKSFFQSTGYQKKFRKDVHTLLDFGYKRVRATINADTQEPTITGRIAEEINKGLQTIGLLPESVLKPRYVVIPENSKIKTTDPNNIKDSFIRLDIVILNNRKIPYKQYVVEGKRLKKKNFSRASDKYFDEGVTRFVDETYAADSPEAMMVGFWQDESATYWFDEITQKFEEKELNVEEKLTLVEIIPEIPLERFSVHKRKSGNKILVFHVLLDCV